VNATQVEYYWPKAESQALPRVTELSYCARGRLRYAAFAMIARLMSRPRTAEALKTPPISAPPMPSVQMSEPMR